jgi:hypothetical protein
MGKTKMLGVQVLKLKFLVKSPESLPLKRELEKHCHKHWDGQGSQRFIGLLGGKTSVKRIRNSN